MSTQISQALRDALEDVARHAEEAISHAAYVGEGMERIRCLIDANDSAWLSDRERLQELRMTAHGSPDGIPLEDQAPDRQDDAA